MVKNGNGRTPRLLAKDEEHKEAMKECRKAEKLKPGKPGTDKWAVRVRVDVYFCSGNFKLGGRWKKLFYNVDQCQGAFIELRWCVNSQVDEITSKKMEVSRKTRRNAGGVEYFSDYCIVYKQIEI